MASTIDDLSDLIAEIRAEPRHRIRPESRLGEDLHVDGDDWDEVLIAITTRWKTDFTGFVFHDYFGDEPNLLSLFVALKNLLIGKRLKPLTIAHLAAVIDKGTWFEPDTTPA